MSAAARDLKPRLAGYLAEFETADALFLACRRMRDEGYTRWDAHTPFPVHGLDDAMGLSATKLPYLVLGGAACGAGLGLLLQWWTNAIDYPVIISGKPLFPLPANIPVIFEMTVLFGALSAFLGMLVFNGLPHYHHPLHKSVRFKRATRDRFFISVEAGDPRFEAAKTRALLQSLGSSAVEDLEED